MEFSEPWILYIDPYTMDHVGHVHGTFRGGLRRPRGGVRRPERSDGHSGCLMGHGSCTPLRAKPPRKILWHAGGYATSGARERTLPNSRCSALHALRTSPPLQGRNNYMRSRQAHRVGDKGSSENSPPRGARPQKVIRQPFYMLDLGASPSGRSGERAWSHLLFTTEFYHDR